MDVVGWFNLTSDDVVHALTYTVNYHAERSWYIGHAWSLSVEEQFYLLAGRVAFCGKVEAMDSLFCHCNVSIDTLKHLVSFPVLNRVGKLATGSRPWLIPLPWMPTGTQEWLKLQRPYHRIGVRLFSLVPVLFCMPARLYLTVRG